MKRLHEVCVGASLGAEAERKLEQLLELLAQDPESPTSVADPEQAIDVHVADSFSVLPLLERGPALATVVDIGSGAGFPGLPLAIALDQAAVDMVESTARKCRFIDRAIARLGQSNARAVCVRAEDWARAEGAERYGLAVARAVAPLATLVEYAAPLLREGGLLVAWKGARDPGEERQGAAAAHALGMRVRDVLPVTPFEAARHRHLHVFDKVAPTPAAIPRRPGIARKRPFGAESSMPNQ